MKIKNLLNDYMNGATSSTLMSGAYRESLDNLKKRLADSRIQDKEQLFEQNYRLEKLPRPGELRDRLNEAIVIINRLEKEVAKFSRQVHIQGSIIEQLLETEGIKSLIKLTEKDNDA